MNLFQSFPIIATKQKADAGINSTARQKHYTIRYPKEENATRYINMKFLQ